MAATVRPGQPPSRRDRGSAEWSNRSVQAPAVLMSALYACQATESAAFTADGNLMLTPHAGERPVACALPT